MKNIALPFSRSDHCTKGDNQLRVLVQGFNELVGHNRASALSGKVLEGDRHAHEVVDVQIGRVLLEAAPVDCIHVGEEAGHVPRGVCFEEETDQQSLSIGWWHIAIALSITGGG